MSKTRKLTVVLFAAAWCVLPARALAAPPMSFNKTVINLSQNFSSPQAVALGDLDQANGSDIVVMGNHGDLAVLLNQGGGRFGPPAYLPSPCGFGSATSLAVGPFSADANPDILVACEDNVNDGFKRLRGNGDGTFASPDTLAPIQPLGGGGATITRLSIGAFGGEGAALTYVQWFPPAQGNNLMCFFRLPDLIADFDAGGTALPLCSVQFGPNDSVLDVVTINGPYALGQPPFNWPDQAAFTFLPDGNLGAVVYSSGTPLPQFIPGPNVEEYVSPHSIPGADVEAAGDLNGDGIPEIVALTGDLGFVVYSIEPSQDISPGFRQIPDPAIVPTDPAHGFPANAVIADFNGDGLNDVAVLTDIGDGHTGTIEIHPGLGDGTFGSAESFGTDSDSGRLVVADLDGLGLPDIVNLNRGANVLTVLLNTTPAVPCSYAIDSTGQNVAAAGGSGSVGVTAPPGCAWTAASNAGFVTITSPASGTGNGIVSYAVAINNGLARTGTMTIAGQTFNVSQDAAPAVAMSAPTPVGVNVAVQVGGVRIVFSRVDVAGMTTLTPGDPCAPGDPCRGLPIGFSVFGNLAFDIQTTATVTGPITLSFDLSRLQAVPPPIIPPDPITPALVSTLRVFHGENGVLVDRTTPPDPITPPSPIVVAVVSSLSPFLIARQPPQDALESTRSDLRAVGQAIGNRHDDVRLDLVIRSLTLALRPGLWRDPTRLQPHAAPLVLAALHAAVIQLRLILDDGRSSLPHATVRFYVDRIIDVARRLDITCRPSSTTGEPHGW